MELLVTSRESFVAKVSSLDGGKILDLPLRLPFTGPYPE